MKEPLARAAAGATLSVTGAAMTAILVAFCTSPASALSDEDWDTCARSADLSSDRPIRGCTAIISAGERILAQLVAAYNNRALAFRANGDLDRAIEDYDRAIRLMPDHYVAINNRGVALMAKGELDRAITDFDQAIRLKSDYLAAFGARSAAYSRKGMFDHAIADLDVVIKADPKNQVLIRERGTIKSKMGDGVGAEADFRRAEALAPAIRPRFARNDARSDLTRKVKGSANLTDRGRRSRRSPKPARSNRRSGIQRRPPSVVQATQPPLVPQGSSALSTRLHVL